MTPYELLQVALVTNGGMMDYKAVHGYLAAVTLDRPKYVEYVKIQANGAIGLPMAEMLRNEFPMLFFSKMYKNEGTIFYFQYPYFAVIEFNYVSDSVVHLGITTDHPELFSEIKEKMTKILYGSIVTEK